MDVFKLFYLSLIALSFCFITPSMVEAKHGRSVAQSDDDDRKENDDSRESRSERDIKRACLRAVQKKGKSLYSQVKKACRQRKSEACINAKAELEVSKLALKEEAKACLAQSPTTPPPPAPASCQFNGKSLASGSSVLVYQASSVASGQSCVSETRVCNNGTLSGTYLNTSCSVAAPPTPVACSFNGQSVASGQSITAYQSTSVPFGQSCVSQSRTCTNGALSGNYTAATCKVDSAPPPAANCSFNGQTLASGQSVNAYQAASVAFGQTCTSQSRTCTNGSLSGSYGFASCSVAAAANCSFNGQFVANGQGVTAFQASSVPFGQSCVSQARTCSNGALSGSYSFASCTVAAAASCSFNGQTVASGQSVNAYQASSVPFGTSCVNQARSCSNGTLSGSYTFASCTVAAAPAIDGSALYSQKCSACHGAVASSSVRGSSASSITSALQSVSQMKNNSNLMGLTPAEISALATALGGRP